MIGPCLCGDTECPSCGPAQGTRAPECDICGDRSDDVITDPSNGDAAVCARCRGAEPDDDLCPSCDGTGIGQHGDPDTSVCQQCGGGGERRNEPDPDRAYDEWRDRKAGF